jgi:zinc/manganese transport system ATP-binding protein/zinc transport system ATP-binding protein
LHPLIELRQVTFGYGQTPILENINLHLHPGQFAALVGPSGAGKSTLLKLILGTLSTRVGEIYMSGRALNSQPTPQIGYVPQLETVDWNFPVTVEEVVLMGRIRRLGIWPWPTAADKRRIRTRVLILDNFAKKLLLRKLCHPDRTF